MPNRMILPSGRHVTTLPLGDWNRMTYLNLEGGEAMDACKGNIFFTSTAVILVLYILLVIILRTSW
jgi:hypothetical protein